MCCLPILELETKPGVAVGTICTVMGSTALVPNGVVTGEVIGVTTVAAGM